MNNKFCTNCGTQLNPAAKFCSKCGTPIESNPAASITQEPHQPVQSPSAIPYSFIMPATYKKSIVSLKGCSLIFSDDVIMTAMIDNKMMKQHIADIKESVKGEKLLKRTAAVMKAGYTYPDKYWKMNPDQIMAETQNNFAIKNNTVQQIKFKKGDVVYSSDNTTTNTPPTITIKSTGGKYIYTMNSGFDSKSFISVLQSLFPGQYKGPKK